MTLRKCQGCDTILPPRKPGQGGRYRKWCSDTCRKLTLYSKRCVDCGTTINTDGRVRDAAIRCKPCNNGREEHRRAAHERFRGQNRWSDDQILDALRGAAVDGRLTANMYERRASGPTCRTVTMRFGSWSAAVEAAGLSHGRGRSAYTHASVDECLTALRACARAVGRGRPSVSQYETWSRGLDVPCCSTVRHRCGGWTEALDMATIEAMAA